MTARVSVERPELDLALAAGQPENVRFSAYTVAMLEFEVPLSVFGGDGGYAPTRFVATYDGERDEVTAYACDYSVVGEATPALGAGEPLELTALRALASGWERFVAAERAAHAAQG
jgi:hypothetical protein